MTNWQANNLFFHKDVTYLLNILREYYSKGSQKCQHYVKIISKFSQN